MQKSLWNQTQFQNKSQIFSCSADAHFAFNNKFVFLRFRIAEIYFTIHRSSILNPHPDPDFIYVTFLTNWKLQLKTATENCNWKLQTEHWKLRLKTENCELKTKNSLPYFTKKKSVSSQYGLFSFQVPLSWIRVRCWVLLSLSKFPSPLESACPEPSGG